MDRTVALEPAWQDLRYAVRGLLRQPGFAAVAIGILAISTGLLTTLVVFADATLLQPWRVPEPARVRIIRPARSTSDGFGAMRVPEYVALRQSMASWHGLSLTVRGGSADLTFENGSADRVDVLEVTSDYFDTLGLRLPIGRTFTPEEDSLESTARVAIISHRLWRTHLGGDAGVIGRQVRIGARPHTIVGVTPEGFLDGHGSRREVWVPLLPRLGGTTPQERRAYLDPHHGSIPYAVVGRLARGASDATALAELNTRSTTYRTGAELEAPGFRLLDTRPISRSSLASDDYVQVLALVALALVLALIRQSCETLWGPASAGPGARRVSQRRASSHWP